MVLNQKIIQQLDSKQIYQELLPIFEKLYNEYKYMEISQEEYSNLIIKEINNSKKTYNNNQDYGSYLKEKIKRQLLIKAKKMINNSDYTFNILNSYINQTFTSTDSYSEILKYFNQLNTFLKSFSYVPNPDLLIELVTKNAIFNSMVTTVFREKEKQIMAGYAPEIFDNNLLLLTIDTFCMLNNITIQESVEENSNDLANDLVANSTKMYLNEISKKPLLTIEEEKELALKIADGNSQARDEFIERNLKLVVSIAKKYVNRGLPFLDLIQEGNIGLIIAVDRYDVTKGYRFSTYASHWIKSTMGKAIENKGRNIRLPVHIQEDINYYQKTLKKLEDKLGRSPTIKEIAQEMHTSVSKVSQLWELQNDTISINSLVNNESDTELENFIPSSEEPPEDIAIDDSLRAQLINLLEKDFLKPKEKEILILRYGFNNNQKPMTLQEIGEKYNLTRERVRQIIAKSLRLIRKSSSIKSLIDYTDDKNQAKQNIKEYQENYKNVKNRNKTFLNSYKEKDSEKNMRKIQTIYEYFDTYSKEAINEMLTKLTEAEKELVTLRYGEDLNNPVTAQLTSEQRNKFYGSLIPKMKRLLDNPNAKITTRKPREKRNIEKGELLENNLTVIEESSNEILRYVVNFGG